MRTILNFIVSICKKVILSFCIIYAFDIVASGLNIIIPINIVTIIVVSILGIPGLLALIGIYYLL